MPNDAPGAPKRQSSAEMSSLAASLLPRQTVPHDQTVPAAIYNELLTTAKRLAGSVLSQDERAGQ